MSASAAFGTLNLVRNGARPEQIFVTGIPVRQQFLGEVPKRDKEQKKILIMGGGLGIIPNLDQLMQMLTVCLASQQPL